MNLKAKSGVMQLSILSAVAFSLLLAQSAEGEELRMVPYERLPRDVRASVLEIFAEACDADPKTALKEALVSRVYRADLGGDGVYDYVMDEWSGHCFRNPAHYIHVWKPNPNGHYKLEEHVEALLERGPWGFAWIQTRCNREYHDDFQVESYRNGKRTVSPCYPAKGLEMELRRRELVDAFPH